MVDTFALFQIADTAEEAGNYDLARQSFERAASLGNADCLSRLAYMYDVGLGVQVDKSHAMRLYKQAWRRRSHVAANNIAILYREQGKHRLMFQWFMRAANSGDGDALVELAKCHLHGTGVRRSAQNAMRSLASALNSNCITEASREKARSMQEDLRPRAI
jgi:TPR repeat protein